MNPLVIFQQIKKSMTPEEAFIAGWNAGISFYKSNSSEKPSAPEKIISSTPLGRFADGAG